MDNNDILLVPPYSIDKAHLNMFDAFMVDTEETEMYISGEGGSGKTTLLVHFVRELLYTRAVPYLVGAYTHQACRILRDKIYVDPTSSEAQSEVRTVHSFLKKAPGINDSVLDITKIKVSTSMGTIEPPKVLLFDEYSMIGEDDYHLIGQLTTDDEGEVVVKVIYIGDAMQLPPVKSARAIWPRGKYQIRLTTNYRAGAGLQPVLDTLRKMKETKKIVPLPASDCLHRNSPIVTEYIELMDESTNIMLAYTNLKVDTLNNAVHHTLYGTTELETHDKVFVDTRKAEFEYIVYSDFFDYDEYTINNDDGTISNFEMTVETNSGQLTTEAKDTYNTIPYILKTFDCMVIPSKKDHKRLVVKAYIFGNTNFKNAERELQEEAVACNALVDELMTDEDREGLTKSEALKKFCANNRHLDEVRSRSQAWRQYMSFNQYVTMLSRPYASTVHKVQGGTYDNVMIAGSDLLKLYRRDKMEYLSLFYTAVSRAKDSVYIDN